LNLLAESLPADCELVGIDSDSSTVARARQRALQWQQPATFGVADFDADPDAIPDADIFLAFNIFPYVSRPLELLECLRRKLRPGGCVIVRQYDGALIRLGPMAEHDRRVIDTSLMAAVLGSGQFKHYDMDRVFDCIHASSYTSKETDFEIFRRVAPFPPEFRDYFLKTVEWTHTYVSEDAQQRK
jgi:SAM-dependent methyltransferase